MIRKSALQFGLGIAFFLTLILISACSAPQRTTGRRPAEGTYQVDPRFREFYNHLGGNQRLGPAISEMREFNQYQVQFTTAALMVYDRQAGANQHFSLAPLGLELGVSEPPVPPPVGSEVPYVNGHVIYNKFLPVYEELGGARFVGFPITEAKYNPEFHRLEQYFENLGFYIPDSDPAGNVYLLAYGAYKCDVFCRYKTFRNSRVYSSNLEALDPVFTTATTRLGSSFTGTRLSNPVSKQDSTREVIFTNIVLYVDSQNPNRVYARPIVEMLGFQPHALVNKIDDPRMDFFLLEGDLGHNVPVIFTDYLAQHGGLDIAGPPITEVFVKEEGIYRQCFTNLCLDYEHSAEDTKIRLASLGNVYKNRFIDEPIAEGEFTNSQSLQTMTIKVWEIQPMITSAESQEIFVGIFEGQIPLPHLEPELLVGLPQEELILAFPPTDEDGFTHLELPPVEARNGTIIPYDVCIENLMNERSCVSDSFLIWGNP